MCAPQIYRGLDVYFNLTSTPLGASVNWMPVLVLVNSMTTPFWFLTGRASFPPPPPPPRLDRGIVAREVRQLFEVIDVAGRRHLRDADVHDAEPVDGERMVLALVRELAVPPGHADADRDRLALDGDLPGRRLLPPPGPPHHHPTHHPPTRAPHL